LSLVALAFRAFLVAIFPPQLLQLVKFSISVTVAQESPPDLLLEPIKALRLARSPQVRLIESIHFVR